MTQILGSKPGGMIEPNGPADLSVGEFTTVQTTGTVYDCNGYPTNIGSFSMDSWWMDDSSIASYSPEYGESTVVEGLAIGETIINGSWSWDQWDLVDGWSQCVESRGQSTDSQHVNVQRRPHHLKVGNDLLGSMNNCGGVKRILDWIVVDQPGTHPVGNISPSLKFLRAPRLTLVEINPSSTPTIATPRLSIQLGSSKTDLQRAVPAVEVADLIGNQTSGNGATAAHRR